MDRLRVTLGIGTAIDGLLENLPTEIVVRDLAFQERSRGGKDGHDRGPRDEHIVQEACVVNVKGLIGDLETGGSHTKVHGIHVNLTRVRLILRLELHVGMLVFEQRHLDVNFLAASLVD